MKQFCQVLKPILSLEKDDKKNTTGMQMRVWYLDNETTIVVRLFKHNSDVYEKLWHGKKTNGDVDTFILNLLEKRGLVQDVKNWDYTTTIANLFSFQDEFEEKENCCYFAWSVKRELIYF